MATAGAPSVRPPITIVVSTVEGWPGIKAAVETHRVAAERAAGVLLVTDGSGLPPPDPADLGPSVTWRSFPDESVFQLRERGYREATGEIVAITEDHCFVPPDWAERMVAAHAAHPDAAAIGGSVTNGATGSLIDWASFLVVQSVWAAPIRSGPTDRIAGAVNSSYKRSALERLDSFGGLGAMDGIHQADLQKAGASFVSDDSIRVVHDQSLGVDGTARIHFHAGRTISGFRRQRMDAVQVARLVGSFFVPLARFGVTVKRTAGRGYVAQLVRGAPAILLLLYVQAAGQLVGYVLGAGDSPKKVR